MSRAWDAGDLFADIEQMLHRGVALGWDWLGDGPPLTWSERRRKRLSLELDELDEALKSGDHKAIADELGDVVIVLVSLAIVHGIDPEAAVRDAVAKVTRRLDFIQASAGPGPFDLETLRRLWTEAKRAERAAGEGGQSVSRVTRDPLPEAGGQVHPHAYDRNTEK